MRPVLPLIVVTLLSACGAWDGVTGKKRQGASDPASTQAPSQEPGPETATDTALGTGDETSTDPATNTENGCSTAALKVDVVLKSNDSVVSCNGFFHLTVQENGNVALLEKRDGEVAELWSTHTAAPGAYAIFQKDGNFVVYDANASPLFQTGTSGTSDAKMLLRNDGNLVIFSGPDVVWSSNTTRQIGRGLQFPIAIDPVVNVSDAQFLIDVYPIVLGRSHDAAGVRALREKMELQSYTRGQVVSELVGSPEFAGNASLRNKSSFVARAFQTILGHAVGDAELTTYQIRLKDELGQGIGDLTWLDLINQLYASSEYKAKTCETSYYTYGEKIKESALSLRHVFNGKAQLPQIKDSQAIGLDFSGGSVGAIYDQKLPTVKSGDGYLGFTRGDIGSGTYNIFALETTDGVTFKNISGAGIFNRVSKFPAPDSLVHYNDFYDPHVSIDHSTCPPRYVMAMECALYGVTGLPSFCTSFTSTPRLPETWSTPQLVVRGCAVNASDSGCENSERQLSASTGVTLIDGTKKFIKWTELDDGKIDFQASDNSLNPDEGDERALSKGAQVSDFSTYLNSTKNVATSILNATASVHCTDAWDCNNRDVHDWKKEDEQYYVIYSGANYYRCDRPGGQGTSIWGVGISRSRDAVGGTQEMLPYDKAIRATRNDTCGITYPMINAINGELFVYYSYKGPNNTNHVVRGALQSEASP